MELNLSELHKRLLTYVPYSYSNEHILIIDFVTIMGSIFYYDIKEPTKENAIRNINIEIPVYNVEHWVKLTKEIERLTKWVSEDNFHIQFVENKYINSEINYILPLPNEYDVTLFSGGLDSLSGAFYNFKNSIKSDYVGFINKGEEKTHQVEIEKFYRRTFDDNTSVHLIDKFPVKKVTYIQSTRSLLYFALGIAKAHFNNSRILYLFENGILSLNPELNNRYTTKTTHPKTIYLYNNLLNDANINISIKHPFLFRTKGEIINDMNHDFLNVVRDTFTCGQGRNPIKSHKGQCGTCIPCLLRKISVAAYNNEDYDVKYNYPYGTKFKDIDDMSYRNDYESNFDYFKRYCDSIKKKQIYLEIDVHKGYYSENINYKQANKEMFDKFVIEFERFIEKHDPY